MEKEMNDFFLFTKMIMLPVNNTRARNE